MNESNMDTCLICLRHLWLNPRDVKHLYLPDEAVTRWPGGAGGHGLDSLTS